MRTGVCDAFISSATPCTDFFLFIDWPVLFGVMVFIGVLFWYLTHTER